VLRDILQFDRTVDDAISRVTDVTRTCWIWVGVGDNTTGEFRLINYSAPSINVFDPYNSPFEPHIEDMVYVGINQQCLSELLTGYRGQIDPQVVIQNILPVVQTGDLHAVVYDFQHNLMFVSNAPMLNVTSGSSNAFDRIFVQLDMNEMWAEQPPAN